MLYDTCHIYLLTYYRVVAYLLCLATVCVQVFFSSYVFSTNVMVKVATRPAVNPVGRHFMLCVIFLVKHVSLFTLGTVKIYVML